MVQGGKGAEGTQGGCGRGKGVLGSSESCQRQGQWPGGTTREVLQSWWGHQGEGKRDGLGETVGGVEEEREGVGRGELGRRL